MLLGILLGPGDTYRPPASDVRTPEEAPSEPVSNEELRRQYLEELDRLRRELFNGNIDEWETSFVRARIGVLMMLLGTLPAEKIPTSPSITRGVTITNSTGGSPDAATTGSDAATVPTTHDEWKSLASKDPVRFLRTVRRWDVDARRAIAAEIDKGGSAEQVLGWFRETVLPTVTTLTTLIREPRQWPSDRHGLVHDLAGSFNGYIVTEIHLENGNLVRVRAMYNSDPGHIRETIIAIQFELETVLFSIDGLHGIHLAPAISPGLFNSILRNLFYNSAQHPGADPLKIEIRLRGRTLTISDNGAGMSPEALANIRNGIPIHNGVPVDTNGPNNGHGEGWSKSIRESCNRLGIQWAIDSVGGKGTTVSLTLPPNSLDLDDQFTLSSRLDEETIRDHLIPFFGVLTPDGQERLLAEWARVAKTTPEELTGRYLLRSSPEARAALEELQQAVDRRDEVKILHASRRYVEATRDFVRNILNSHQEFQQWFDQAFVWEIKRTNALRDAIQDFPDINYQLVHDISSNIVRLNGRVCRAVRGTVIAQDVRAYFSPPSRSIEALLRRQMSNNSPLKIAAITYGGIRKAISDHIDLGDIERIVANLIQNATEHPREGQRIVVIEVRLEGNQLIFTDNASGMDAATRAALTTGQRVHNGVIMTPETETEETKAHGHGWEIIRSLCAKWGIAVHIDDYNDLMAQRSLHVYSKETRTTRITLTLPPNFLIVDEHLQTPRPPEPHVPGP